MSKLRSLKIRSRPGCICLAIIGKLFKRSLKDLMSFLSGLFPEKGVPDDPADVELAWSCGVALIPAYSCGRIAGVILIDSVAPTNGFEM